MTWQQGVDISFLKITKRTAIGEDAYETMEGSMYPEMRKQSTTALSAYPIV